MKAAARHCLRSQAITLSEHDREDRNAERCADIEHARDATDEGGLLRLRPHHESRRVAKRNHRQIESIAKLKEARRFVGAWGINRSPEMQGIFANKTERPPFNPAQPGEQARRKALSHFEPGVR